jgi:peptide/nickel transport system permease protein
MSTALVDGAGAPVPVEAALRPPHRLSRVWRQLRRDRAALAGLGFLALLLLVCVAAPLLAPYDPLSISGRRLLSPAADGHLLGTDGQGRDLFSRVLHGAPASLVIGIAPVLLSMVIGGAYGLVAGAYGGWLRTAMMRAMDVLFAFPAVLLAIAIGVVLGPGITTPVVALTVVLVPAMARVAEGATLVVSASEYVEAARASGAPRRRTTLVHVLPNVLPAVASYCFSMFGPVLVFGAGLSFLGLGAQPPTPEWGSMLSSLQESIWIAPVTAMVPGIPIMLTALAFDSVGNAVRDLLDPRLSS